MVEDAMQHVSLGRIMHIYYPSSRVSPSRSLRFKVIHGQAFTDRCKELLNSKALIVSLHIVTSEESEQ